MGRVPFIAGNWKMNLTPHDALALATGVKKDLAGVTGVDVALCPPFVYLADVSDALAGSSIGLGAQNICAAEKGAYTGEVAGFMLKEIGCEYVIIGHSERRQYYAETDRDVNVKIRTALKAGLQLIVCVGETKDERQKGVTDNIITRQMTDGFSGITAAEMENITIAYEPVWAIGTGLVATPEQAQAVHKLIRSLVEKKYGGLLAGAIRIQYGGSVKPDNIDGLICQPDIDGALVGGASLAKDDFVALVKRSLVKK